MKFYKLSIFFLIFLPIMVSAQTTNTFEAYNLSKDSSLLLPHFDTASIVDSDVENIVLSLYVLSASIDEKTEVQFTVNPVNLESREKLDGISIFRNIRANAYLDITLPRELFERMVGTEDRLFLRLVNPNKAVVFAGVNSATTAPKLTIETAEVEEPSIPNVSLAGIREINNSTIIINTGDGTVNNNKDGLPWWLTQLLLPLVIALVVGFLIYKFGWNK